MEAVILAGGLGTRISSRLKDLPKSMAPIGGRPFLQLLLDQLVVAGCTRALLSVGHLRESILDVFGDNYNGMELAYIIEDRPLGTGGAIRLALSRAHEPATLVLNGDTYIDLNFSAISAFHDSARRPMTMAVTHVRDSSRYGGVIVEDGRVVGFTEKGSCGSGWINAGVYMLDQDFPWPMSLASRFSFETDVLSPALDQIRPAAFLSRGYFLDIGVPEDLDRAQKELGDRVPDRSR
jgi:D-glycero-alpha-D-manno-heptose 1-phosphate guanylyltransferase